MPERHVVPGLMLVRDVDDCPSVACPEPHCGPAGCTCTPCACAACDERTAHVRRRSTATPIDPLTGGPDLG